MKQIRWFTTVLIVTFASSLAAEGEVVVVNYGGAYERACIEGYYNAFTEETGIEVKVDQYDGSLAQIRAQVEAGPCTGT